MRNKTEAFFIGAIVGILILAIIIGVGNYIEGIKPGDIVETWNPDTTKREFAVVISVEKTEYSEHYTVYPIKIENWNFKRNTENIKKMDYSRVHY